MTAAASSIPFSALAQLSPQESTVTSPPVIHPPKLKPGDSVAVIAPASPIGKPEDLTGFLDRVKALGLNPVQGPNLAKEFGFFGGTDQERADDIMWAFNNSDIKAIMPIRGGYGCTRLLHLLDFKQIKRNPKILVGYSDITALLVSIQQQTGMVTYHGPVLASSESEFADSYLKTLLFEPHQVTFLKNPVIEDENYHLRTITSGIARGTLTGGNLTILASMCGTPYQLQTKGKILFLEDVSEAPYRIDRMLTQLIHSGALEGVQGIVTGQFAKCDPESPRPDEWLVADVIQDRLVPLKVPILSNAAFGHVKDKWTLPLGMTAELDADQKTLQLFGK